jgi:hypothetical protein
VAWGLQGTFGATPSYRLGTLDSQTLRLVVNDMPTLRLIPSGSPSEGGHVIGGWQGNVCTADYASVIAGGGSANNPNAVHGDYCVVGGGWSNIAGSSGTPPGDQTSNTVAGGFDNIATGGFEATVNGGFLNRATASYATVGGGQNNAASANSATIAGGGGNRASFLAATVGGGQGNTASNNSAFVGGGDQNTASGPYSSVTGGQGNSATQWFASIGGGRNNLAEGLFSTIPGGDENVASGDYSFAAGRRAKIAPNHHGSFVWAGNGTTQVPSLGVDSFVVQASGGAWFYSHPNLSSGVRLDPGAGAWSNLSDRASKTGFASVDAEAVLDKLLALPILEWSYKTENPSVRHVGPTAQDFRAAFGLGSDDTTISTVDLDGIALVAIQALARRTAELRARTEETRRLSVTAAALREQLARAHAELAELRAACAELEDTRARIAELEALVRRVTDRPAGGASR